MQFLEQRLGDAPGALDLVRGAIDCRRQVTGPSHGVGSARVIHLGLHAPIDRHHCGVRLDRCQ
jgi:hypothetical protein